MRPIDVVLHPSFRVELAEERIRIALERQNLGVLIAVPGAAANRRTLIIIRVVQGHDHVQPLTAVRQVITFDQPSVFADRFAVEIAGVG